MDTIRNTAMKIVAPSVQPVAIPSLYIPIPVETKEAASKIYNIVSPKHSMIISQTDVNSFSIGMFSPYVYLKFAIVSLESIPVLMSDLKFLTKPISPPKSLTFLTLIPSIMLDISKSEDNTSLNKLFIYAILSNEFRMCPYFCYLPILDDNNFITINNC